MRKKTAPIPLPFVFKDCALITRMAGVKAAINLRELQDRIRDCPVDCLFHHFCEVQIRPSFDDPVYHNDFALWADRHLRDPIVAERIGALNPYALLDLEALRIRLIEIIDERLGESEIIPWARRGDEFYFLQGVTTVFSTGHKATSVDEFCEIFPKLSLSSIYYHFIEARRRTVDHANDFSAWLRTAPNPPNTLIEQFEWLDFYSYNLTQLRERLLGILAKHSRRRITS